MVGIRAGGGITTEAKEGPESLQVLDRAINVLKAFADARTDLGVSELARRFGLAKSVVHRTLTSLVRNGFLMKDEASGRYRLGPDAMALGLAALGNVDLLAVATPHMEILRSRTRETVTLSVRVDFARVYVSQLPSPQDVKMTVEIGKKWPLYAGATGRAILSAMPEEEVELFLARTSLKPLTGATIVSKAELLASVRKVQEVGYAQSRGERDPWAGALAAAVASPVHGVLGAISVCGPLSRFTPERVQTFVPNLLEAARNIGDSLGAFPLTQVR